nr:uncharacterized protein LOC123281038 isoform X9 [Equus asinus]
MDSSSVLAPPSSWEEDRKFVLRAWCLVFSILATLMALTMMDGRMAYMQGSHTGYVGIWIDCRKHQCAIPGQVTVAVVRRTSCCDWLDLDHMLFLKVSGAVPSVRSTRTDGGWRLPPNKIELLLPEEQERMLVLIHMSMGCMMLALMLCLVLLLTMGISFWPVFRRLNKIDLVFSSLSFSVGFLIVLSLTLFVVNCETLRPRPQPPPPGTLSYLNQVGMWSKGTYSRERRVSRRRVTTQSTPRHVSDQQSDADP